MLKKYEDIMSKINDFAKEELDFSTCEFDEDKAVKIAPAIRMMLMENGKSIVSFSCSKAVLSVATKEGFAEIEKAYTCDNLSYMRDCCLFVPGAEDLEEQYEILKKNYK